MEACIYIPLLPLQQALLDKPKARREALVVVADDKPHSKILYLNQKAKQHKIRIGQKFSQAQVLSSVLHSSILKHEKVKEVESHIADALTHFSPSVERLPFDFGIFIIEAGGFERLYGSTALWADAIQNHIQNIGYRASVVVAHHRSSALAITHQKIRCQIFENAHQAWLLAQKTPLIRLPFSHSLQQKFSDMSLYTLKDFVKISRSDIRLRFGKEGEKFHRWFKEKNSVHQKRHFEVLTQTIELDCDPPESDLHRLLFQIKAELHPLLQKLEQRSEALSHLRLKICFRDHASQASMIEMAEPTLDAFRITELLLLRLQSFDLPQSIESLSISLGSCELHPEQFALLLEKRRDLRPLKQAIARVQAAFGPSSVGLACLEDAILPEAQFRIHQELQIKHPKARKIPLRPLVRRSRLRPLELPPRSQLELGQELSIYGQVQKQFGPQRYDGGWWVKRIIRDYYYIKTSKNSLIWVYFDAVRKTWVQQGLVD